MIRVLYQLKEITISKWMEKHPIESIPTEVLRDRSAWASPTDAGCSLATRGAGENPAPAKKHGVMPVYKR